MTTSTPLVFRPSLAQRAMAALLCAGSWLVGGRALVLLMHNLPRLVAALRQAQGAGAPTFWIWAGLAASLTACLGAGVLLVLSVLGLLLMEGTQVLVDELGVAVEHTGIPLPLSRWLGSGRVTWKRIQALDKRRFFFVLTGTPPEESPLAPPGRVRFLMVDRLEELVLLIIERSPNLRFRD
jgi:hypothetical protein